MPKIFCHKCFSMLNSILKRVCFLKFLYLWVPYFAKFHSSLWSLWPSKIRATELDLTSALMFSTVVNTFLSININKARRCFVRKTFCQDCLRSFVRTVLCDIFFGRTSLDALGRRKKTVFSTFGQKGKGVSANPKNPYQKILRFFYHFGSFFGHFFL